MDESKLDENRIGRKALDQNRLDENWAHGVHRGMDFLTIHDRRSKIYVLEQNLED